MVALLLAAGASGARALQAPPPSPSPSPDPANFRGRVVTDSTALPIRGAFVELVGTVLRCVTDSVGAFEILAIPAGTYVVRVRATGFLQEFFEIEAEDGLDLEGVIALKRAPVEASREKQEVRSEEGAVRVRKWR